MSRELMMVIAFSPAVALVVVAALFLASVLRDPGRPTTPDWLPAEMSALVLPTGEHELIGARAFQQIADDTGHIPLHDWDATPPSMRRALWRMTPAERARALTYELGNYWWRPDRCGGAVMWGISAAARFEVAAYHAKHCRRRLP